MNIDFPNNRYDTQIADRVSKIIKDIKKIEQLSNIDTDKELCRILDKIEYYTSKLTLMTDKCKHEWIKECTNDPCSYWTKTCKHCGKIK